MKKILTCLVSILSLFVIVGCSNQSSSVRVLQNSKEVYGFEVVSSINLLNTIGGNEQTPLNYDFENNPKSELGYDDELTEIEINEINKYLGIIEQMLGEETPLSIVEENSSRVEFEKRMVITTKDINLEEYTYDLYYNEYSLNDNLEEDDLDEDDLEEDEDEIESRLEGILVIGDKEYEVFGKKEIEEDEMEIEFTSKIDDNNWVKVKQEIEEDETKFEYEISDNGVITNTMIKLESVADETKIELEFENNEMKSKYEFKMEDEDGKKVIKIEVETDTTKIEAKVYVVVDPVTNESSYEYRIKDSNKKYSKDREISKDDENDLNSEWIFEKSSVEKII